MHSRRGQQTVMRHRRPNDAMAQTDRCQSMMSNRHTAVMSQSADSMADGQSMAQTQSMAQAQSVAGDQRRCGVTVMANAKDGTVAVTFVRHTRAGHVRVRMGGIVGLVVLGDGVQAMRTLLSSGSGRERYSD